MATTAWVAKQKRRAALVKKYADLRRQLKKEKNFAALSKLPRDASPTRIRNRDVSDGRPRGYLRKFGLSRVKMRQAAHSGELPGVAKSSW